MNWRIFLRMARLARFPPSREKQILVASVIVITVAIVGIEALFGWPDWAKVERYRLPKSTP